MFKKCLHTLIRPFLIFHAIVGLAAMLSPPDAAGQETALEKKFRASMNGGEYEKAAGMAPKMLAGGTQHLDSFPEEYASLMNLIGVMYAELQEHEKAITYYRLALERIRQVKADTSTECGLYAYNLGMAYNGAGRYETAEPYLLSGLPILARAYGAYSYEYTMMYYQLALMYIEMGRYPEAEGMFNAVLYFFEQTSGTGSDDYQNASANLGRIYEGMGRYEEAERVLLGVLEYYKGGGKAKAAEASVSMNNLAQVYWKTGRMADAEKLYCASLEVLHQAHLSNPLDSATLMNNLALVYKAASRFSEAESAYKSAISIYERLNLTGHPDYTNPLNNLGELYRIMGRSEEAVDLFIKVISLREKLYGAEHQNYANAVNNLGLVYFGLGRYQEAEQMLLISKNIYKKKLGVHHDYYANVLNNLALLYKSSNMLAESEKNYLECLEIARESIGINHPKYAQYLNGAGLMYAAMGEYEGAVDMLQEAMAIIKSAYGDDNYDYIDMQYNLAEVYREMNRYDQARSAYLAAMDGYIILIHRYFPFLNEDDKTAFYHTVNYRFDTFNSFVIGELLNGGADNEVLINAMFDLQLEIKSMLLNEVAGIRSRVLAAGSGELSALLVQWQQAKRNLIAAYAMTEEQRVLNEMDIGAMERSAADMERMINRGLHQSETGYTDEQASRRLLAQYLKDDEALVEMVRVDYYDKKWTDSVYYLAMILTNNSVIPEVVIMDRGRELETVHYDNYRRAIWNREADDHSYDLFWKPMAARLHGLKKVYFTPDGCYHKLNLYTLKNPESGRYLIEDAIIMLQSNPGDILRKENGGKTNSMNAAIFAYPDYHPDAPGENQAGAVVTRSLERYGYHNLPELPGTKTEAELVAGILKRSGYDVAMNLWDDATEHNLKSLTGPGILHIATHGYFLSKPVDYEEILDHRPLNWSDKNPLFRSGLMLAGAAVEDAGGQDEWREDGIFSAYEAIQMDLTGTGLVVLSACETGLGELRNGQGVYGLQRAFIAAGARALLMSLWQVEDQATQELMADFYDRWLSPGDRSKQEAFRESQRDLMKKYPHPVSWGAFVMLGS